MKITRSDPWRLRKPALAGRLMVDTFRGSLRVRRWPLKRGPSKNPAIREQNAWFRAVNRLTRYVVPSQQILAIAITKNSGLYPRDLLMRSMSGGVFDLVDENGRKTIMRRKAVTVAGFQGFRLELDGNITYSTPGQTPVIWAPPIIDTAGMFDLLTPTLVTIPVGINIIELVFGAFFGSGTVAANYVIQLVGGAVVARKNIPPNQAGWDTLTSGALDVEPGQQYEVAIDPGTGTRLLAKERATFFAGTITTVIDT